MVYDLVIIGAGPAGLSAAVYALRYSLKTLVLGQVPGGKIVETVKIENWLGEKSISGADLGRKMLDHAKELGVDFRAKRARGVNKQSGGKPVFEVSCEGGEKFAGRAILIAAGTEHRKLGVPGEKELTGRGVSYCATCDAAFFKNKVVAVVGGGDSGFLGALNLASVAERIYLIHRRSEFKAKPSFVKNARQNAKIELVLEREVVEIFGEGEKVSGIALNKDYKGDKILKVDGIFIEIGSAPDQTVSKQLGIETDKQGYIEVKSDQSTNVKGVFAAGDTTTGSNGMRQIITAAAEGAIAAESVYKFMKRLRD